MTKKEEDLRILKQQVMNFDKLSNDEKERILREINEGKTYGFHSGYSIIDKPWKKYHNGEYEEPETKKTVYQEVRDENLDQPKTTAIEFFMSKISFGNLQKNIELAAQSFKEYNIKKGDFVTIISAGIPETVYSFYGLSKIGAIANLMAPYFDEDGLSSRINDCDSDLLLVMDKFYPQVENAISKSNIKNIVIIPTLNSSVLKLLSKKIELKRTNELLWNQFIKDGKYVKNLQTIGYQKNMPLAMVYSSGTTGASKGILLSNDSFQNSVYAYRKSGVEVGRGYKFYQIIPPWYSTGLSTSIHLPLASGSAVFMDPRFERDIFIKNIISHKPNYAVAPTSMYEGFLDDKLVGNKDLSFFKYPFEGGEPLRKEVSDKIEDVFRKHNSDSKLLVGYGQCECGATITSESQYTNHTDGNVGIPLPGVNLMIADEYNIPLSYGNRGQILVDTPAGMIEYYKSEEATNNYFYIDCNGTKWYSTGDIGYMDEDGNLFIEGRSSDYSIVDDKKVYNFDIEKSIIKDKNVKLCDVIMNNGLLTAHIVFNEEFIRNANDDIINNELENIQVLIYDDIQDESLVPYSFKIREDFPYAKSGKRDVFKMLEETDGFIIMKRYNSNNKELIKK